ncbi:Threonine--tRNA ligase, mitochondrial 1 [Vitis vinifera]|uniref:Threonine--tRNA ligase, mitochondrial 1 n=1 Tax=Vitis vinifera TaxID=29760 RepID=A0A438K0E6_VITVI|nr:Threonine--tRNA ligase, mitochondrial 1 [Vitis vinifera]
MEEYNLIHNGVGAGYGMVCFARMEKQPFERIEVSRNQALEMFSENSFKIEIINDLPEDKTITVYRCGHWLILCRGPHIPNTSFVKAFACLKVMCSLHKGPVVGRLHQLTGEEIEIVKVCKEFMGYLSFKNSLSEKLDERGERERRGREEEEKRRSWKDCCFGVESKEFEIGVEEKKGKPQVVIVESKRGVTSWVRLGLVSVGFLVESLNQCIKDEREGKWERGWKENGRMYSLVRMVNRAGCFLRLRVVDMELKKFNICIPKGRGERRGWILMEESLRKLGEKLSSKENKQEERAVRNHSMKGSYAEIVKRTRGRVGNSVRVEVRGEEINKNLNKLEHCLVGSWNSTSARGEDLERLGWLMADVWGLKGKLGLARLEKGRVLLEFELVGEAKRVLFSGKRSVGGIQLGLERWDSRSGCEEEGEIKNEVWTENLEELQWARILVKTNDGDLPSMLEIGVGGVRYSLTLWWEIRPKIRDNRESFGRSEGEVRGDADSRAGVRVEDLEIARLEAQLLTADGTDGQAVGPLPHGPPVARLLKDAGVDGAGPVTGPACSKVYGLKVRPGPTQSQISWAHFASCNGHNAEAEFFRLREKEIEKKQQKEGSHSATDCALDEEASRYGFALNSGGVRVLGSSSSFHLSFGRTPEGEFFDHSGALREEESPLCILNVDETVGNGSACWDLVEAKCGL